MPAAKKSTSKKPVEKPVEKEEQNMVATPVVTEITYLGYGNVYKPSTGGLIKFPTPKDNRVRDNNGNNVLTEYTTLDNYEIKLLDTLGYKRK